MKNHIRVIVLSFYVSSAAVCWAEGTEAISPTTDQQSYFSQMLVYVYQHDHRLIAERESLKTLDERTNLAYSGFRPRAYGEIAYGRERNRTNGGEFTYGDTRTRTLVGEQPLFSGFSTLEEFKAAKKRVEAGRNQLLLKEEQVLLEAISVYLELTAKQRVLEINYTNNTNIRTQRDGAEKRYKAGDGTKTEIAQSESRLAQSESSLATARAEWEKACASFERATGLEAESMDFPALPMLLPPSLDDAREQAKQIPEVVIKASEFEAASHDVGAAKGSLWPSLSLRGSMGDERGTSVSGSSLLRDDRVTLNLHIPLYQGGGEYARVRQLKNEKARIEEEKIDTKRAARERVSQLWYDYVAAQQVVTSSARAASSAKEALDGVSTEQHEGLRTLLDVLDAQNELLSRQTNEVQAHKELRLSAYRLMAATGKLTARDLQLDTPIYDPQEYYDDNATRWAGF